MNSTHAIYQRRAHTGLFFLMPFLCVVVAATALPVMSVEGTSVQLPCDVTAPSHDKVYMVLWFKDDAGLPLYR